MIKFEDIIVGAYFIFDGYKYRKNSKVSAQVLETKRVKYFTSNEMVKECKDENDNYIASISLNSSNVHNITIVGANLRYTRCIDRKFHTFECNYASYEELIFGLQITSGLTNEIFILTCNLNNKLRQNEDDSLNV